MRHLIAIVLVLAAVSTAQAQTEASFDAFLEQRVTEELASDGILLSRLGVTLDVDVIGDVLVVSLVEDTTGRAVASTKIEEVPADRDVAVASLTQVVATLAQQLGAPAPVVEPAPAPVVDAPLEAEREYRAYAIGFDNVVTGGGDVSIRHDWRAVRGDLRIPMSRLDFYRELGREDLVENRRRHLRTAKALSAVALVGFVVTIAAGLSIPTQDCSIDGTAEEYGRCLDEHDRTVNKHALVGGVGLAVTLVFGVAAVRQIAKVDHLSEKEAKEAADEYNRKLREKLGLPIAFDVSPYVSKDGGGLAVAGSF
jgi:hypothetical protein